MDCYVVEQAETARPGILARLLESLAQALVKHAEPSLHLDLDDMPDRLKRDLGFLDGREPHYDDRSLL
ncbi:MULTISPECIES: hypothetical protein [Rhizobium]|jgi:hypothetical protein|uniref:Uncharacterized protein n=1 Tax=Rhizobium tropici TaxID=398 RepID=A0A329YKT4_RHITR|nr:MULTISPECIES: hypothetical protein [Rhizobium]MBB3287777.1 hypothetical protein [Rhizobium sp. BK252]MBB3402619.1 hypothetical protein [Rhizobium sp. BK289]MBB3415195.1 hypothetical protein [Rhizobium sp. BK284]MBB3483084.1 hypothetical protein [Rhizobium sp. BK347]MDK4720709.1 hypothetical protein [Rhizobium sp. CNPSo 3968]